MDAPIERPDDLTPAWLTETLGAGRVDGFTVERIGTGQMSECYRVALSYGEGTGPASVVLKVAASDPVSRQTGAALGLYEREVGSTPIWPHGWAARSPAATTPPADRRAACSPCCSTTPRRPWSVMRSAVRPRPRPPWR